MTTAATSSTHLLNKPTTTTQLVTHEGQQEGLGVLLYLDVVEGCFVGDIIEQEQGCGERDRALVPVPSRAHGSEHIAQSLWQVTAGDMRCLL